METIKATLNRYGELGTEAIKADVQKVSATGKTAASVHYEVVSEKTFDVLRILGRKFFSTLETGRGPRKGNEYQEFDVSMYEYMQARGIGTDLPEKKRKQLAKFLAYKINKEGDKTYKQGGREVYSQTLTKLVEELKQALKKDAVQFYLNEIRSITKAA
jgi:hypothetical protein